VTDIAIETPMTAAPAASRSSRRPFTLAILAVVGVALAVWGWRRYSFAVSHVETDNAQVDGHITPVAPKVQAFVAQVLVDENQAVHAGDTLVVLDDRDLRVRLTQAEAELATAIASVGSRERPGQARSQAAASQAQALSAQSSIASAEAAFRKASADLERIRGLAQQRIVPAQQLDAAQAAFDAARANLDAARGQASAAGEQALASVSGVGAAEARLAGARAAVETARLQLSYTVLLAPVDGVIGRRSVEVGGLVQVGQTLMSVIPSAGAWVTANLKETELADVKVGDPVSFTVDAYGSRTFAGRVESLSPATGARFALLPPDNASGNFTKVVQRIPVRVAVTGGEDAEHPLRPGMSAVVAIRVK